MFLILVPVCIICLFYLFDDINECRGITFVLNVAF